MAETLLEQGQPLIQPPPEDSNKGEAWPPSPLTIVGFAFLTFNSAMAVSVAQRFWRRLLRRLLLPRPCHALLLPAHVPEDSARVVAAPGAPQGGDVAPHHHAHHCLLPATGVLVPKHGDS